MHKLNPVWAMVVLVSPVLFSIVAGFLITWHDPKDVDYIIYLGHFNDVYMAFLGAALVAVGGIIIGVQIGDRRAEQASREVQ